MDELVGEVGDEGVLCYEGGSVVSGREVDQSCWMRKSGRGDVLVGQSSRVGKDVRGDEDDD